MSHNTVERTGDLSDLLDLANERTISVVHYVKQISDTDKAKIKEVKQLIEESKDEIKNAFEALLELQKMELRNETNKIIAAINDMKQKARKVEDVTKEKRWSKLQLTKIGLTAKELQRAVHKLDGSLGEINRKIKLITEKTISEVENTVELINGKLDGNAKHVKDELTVANKILKRLLTEAEEITKEVELAEKNINDIISAGTNAEPKVGELIAAIEAEEKQKTRGVTW